MHAVDMAEEVQLGDPVDVLLGQLPDCAGHSAACVVDQNIYMAEGIQCKLEQSLNVFIDCDICHLHHTLDTHGVDFFAGFGELLTVNVVQDNVHTALCAFYGNCTADTAGAACNNDNFIFKFFHCS